MHSFSSGTLGVKKRLTSLYWLTHDLRLDDNAVLLQTGISDQLICVYCVDPRWFEPRRYHVSQMSALRWQFLQQSLADVSEQLAGLGQTLHIVYQRPEQAIPEICREYAVDELLLCRQFGVDERRALASIEQQLPALDVFEYDQSTLLEAAELELGFPDLISGFTPFKNRSLMALDTIAEPLNKPTSLPSGPTHLEGVVLTAPETLPIADSNSSALLLGGESAAQQHLSDYFEADYLLRYKETRNALMGFHDSSKLSAWLNSGALSVRRVYAEVGRFERRHERNASTQWMVFELLWRDYFHWLSLRQTSTLFAFRGLGHKKPLTGYYAERFQRWCHGNTAFPLVNACMRELKSTGYLSNRGRQLAASCFVNELQLDWRFGAAWFEHHLLDYQVSVNWGNWQYIAGVGVDPRGGRHFNLNKQQQVHDPDKRYIRRWCGDQDFTQQGPDSVDAADWPIL